MNNWCLRQTVNKWIAQGSTAYGRCRTKNQFFYSSQNGERTFTTFDHGCGSWYCVGWCFNSDLLHGKKAPIWFWHLMPLRCELSFPSTENTCSPFIYNGHKYRNLHSCFLTGRFGMSFRLSMASSWSSSSGWQHSFCEVSKMVFSKSNLPFLLYQLFNLPL